MEETPAQQIPTAEWAIAALGLAIVVVALASLIHEAVSGETSLPEITISVMSIQSRQTGHLVQLQVRNTGEETAAELVIEGVLLTKGGEERSQITLDYVPGGSKREAGLFFKSNPREADLQIRPLGYRNP